MALHLVIMGPPQAGKGTQARRLAERFHFLHLATGDLLRKIARQDTPRGRLVDDLLRQGEYVPDELVTALVIERMGGRNVLLDGYPRTLVQAETLERLGVPVHRVFLLDVPDQVLIDRAQERVFCPQCNAIYGLQTHPPRVAWTCDVCGHGLAQRVDDAPAIVDRRLKVYHQRIEPVVRFYDARGLVQRIDGRGSVEAVARTLEQATAALVSPPRKAATPT